MVPNTLTRSARRGQRQHVDRPSRMRFGINARPNGLFSCNRTAVATPRVSRDAGLPAR
jgi:hypothetical protein